MTQYLYSNVAATHLTSNLAVGGMHLDVESSSEFPSPASGQKVRLTLIGACDDKVEIVDASINCGGCFELSARGLEGTLEQAFVAGDHVVLQLTAGVVQSIYNSYRWYLGPFATAPTTDNDGNPLVEGHLYYDTVMDQLMVWDGSAWQPVTEPAPAVLGRYTYYDDTNPYPAATPLPLTDIYGNVLPRFEKSLHVVQFYLNGVRQVEELDDQVLTGDFTVNYTTQQVIPKAEVPAGATVVLVVGRVDPISLGATTDYTATVDSGFGADDPVLRQFQTIQAAVNDASKYHYDNTQVIIINLAAGAHLEDFNQAPEFTAVKIGRNVGAQVQIVGAGWPSDPALSIIEIPDQFNGIGLTGADVVLHGLTVRYLGSNAGTEYRFGVTAGEGSVLRMNKVNVENFPEGNISLGSGTAFRGDALNITGGGNDGLIINNADAILYGALIDDHVGRGIRLSMGRLYVGGDVNFQDPDNPTGTTLTISNANTGIEMFAGSKVDIADNLVLNTLNNGIIAKNGSDLFSAAAPSFTAVTTQVSKVAATYEVTTRIPMGGSVDEIVKKQTSADYDYDWDEDRTV